ncbi:E3 ubiquitin-protein ligase UBR4-like isoform X2 [Actinia tenebrosa]|uniref:E3 ubiquitin-protein ligase UBR4-like isoform X2 n=1 Tax=Actinia tenebrosa TaxID=6105 RepID=A0A6P8HK13_ACTTE|nr:E3 ubiquitin-protein ligase UBR4-like isoform X2 [Actinia tenebrosa]
MARPANVYKFASLSETDGINHFASLLVEVFWKIYGSCTQVSSIAPLSSIGLQDLESTVTALVDIIHAFTISDSTHAPMAVDLYVKMLLCKNQAISFSCKQALLRLLHPLQKRSDREGQTLPRSGTPSGERISPEDDDGDDDEGEGERSDSGQEEQSSTERDRAQAATQPQPGPSQCAASGGASSSSRSSQLESLLLGAAGNLPAVLDLPQDADDEAMMELAIALSLQEQSVESSGLQLQGLSQGQSSLSLEGGNYSDNTASAAGSEDEYDAPPSSAQGSSAGHSAPRSPIPPGIAQQGLGSESGGSADSITVEPGSSVATTSIDGDRAVSEHGPRSVSSHCSDEQRGCGHSEEEESSHDHDVRHSLQLLLLEELLSHLPNLKDVGGVRAIPFMQVLLMLCSDLEDNDKDIAALDIVLDKCLKELSLERRNYQEMSERTKQHEVQLIVMRFLSVLMSKTKSSAKLASEASSIVCSKTANSLCTVGIVQHCLEILKCLLSHWQKMAKKDEEETANIGGALLKPQAASPPPDMSPFFLRQYVKGHAGDLFESYPQLLTEMVLRLPYQVKKVTDSSDEFKSPEFNEEWMYYLSEYMMVQQTPFVRRQVRKLLLFLCGSKDSYRKQRDLHALDFHCNAVRSLSSQGGFDPDSARNLPIVLSYDSLITMIEHLKACSEIASSRISNWQAYCIQDKSALSFLLKASFLFEEGVAPLILQLLSYAICGSKSQAQASSPHKGRKEKDKDREKVKERDKEKERDKDKEKEKEKANELNGKNEAAASSLVQQLHEFVDMEILHQFVHNFLLESNSTAVRWQAHELLFKIHKYSTPNQQDKLSDMMWKIWPELPGYGRRAAQFVDLLGYFTIKSSSKTSKFEKYSEKAVQLLKTQNGILENHSNSNVYRMLSGFVEFDGYYLESDPCLVCNNPEVPFQSLKLSAIKADFRFTTTSQLVKLIGSHTISRITLRIADMKRQKMVRAITFYYNNRTVQSVVELKNKRPLWHEAKKCHLTPGQTELKVDFPLPIVACNLMIEYSDFYENFQASSETLQCPRCSASVPANPGVCSNCGENVYQCHKCRSINYDERDPFLCNACGFCKYAKFDYTLTARPCCAVDPIENEEDRKKAVASINSYLERADRVYRQLSSYRTPLDLLLTKILEHGDAEVSKSTPTSQASSTYSSTVQSNTNSTSTVNKAIQSLAYRYCVECKASFDELSKIIQKVLASRKELLEYDCRVREQPLAKPISQSDEDIIEHSSSGPSLPRSLSLLPSTSVVPGKCYGCASAATEHCVTLLRALAMSPGTRQRLVEQGLIRELVDFNLHQGTAQMRADVRHLLCLLTKNNEDATEELNHILVQRVTSALEGHRSNPVMVSGIGPEMLLLSNTIEMEDSCWEQRLRCVMRIFMMSVETPSPLVMESITLSCLKILLRLVKPPAPTSKKNKSKDWDSLGTIQSTSEVRINTKQWLEKEHGFQQWRQQAQKKPKGPKKVGKETKEEARQRYLMEKYANRWKMRMDKQQEEPSVPKEAKDEDWLRQVLFTPSSRSARQIACTIVESLCQVPSRCKQMLDLLTSFLDEVGSAGENASEFFQLYQKLIQPSYLKYYLALQGALMQIGRLITKEINRLSYLEQTTLSSDLSQGYALKMLTELLASFIEHDTLKQRFKGRLVGTVLNGYLSLRRLIVQRTKLIDETQELLLELLEEMTTGTEVETRAFMAICVETLNRYGQDDLRTPVFIFERLCNLIYPEENDVGEFFMTLEKDQQQEDFLQGRMQGNPYSSNEPGLGPLMRDVKNKICTDCELVALLEDDSGMELLINNKIISLDLPVKDVYKKVWCPEGEGEPMKIVYRMRGLLGDATEEFLENLDNSKEEDVDEEEVYRMASVLSVCGGLEAMLTRLSAIRNLARGRQLAAVILKLLGYAVKLKVNRQYLCNPSLNALNVLLGTLNQALQMEQESSGGGGAAMAEEVLGIMESILQQATSSPQPTQPPSEGDRTQLDMLLDKITSPFVRASTKVLQAMMRIIPFLTFGDEKNMKTLIIHFMPYLDFEKFDVERSSDETLFIDCFCKIANGIENNSSGARLKEMILENGIVNKAIKYLETYTPSKPFSKANLAELDVWKEFLARPSLPYVLRLLCGLCKGYEKIQLIIGESTIPVIHRLEQVSSEEKVGSLAENLQEALRENLEIEKKITEVRRQTRVEKKKLAMAMREKQLGALGMQTTAGDKIIAKPTSLTREMEDLSEESGLACCICREGYKYHPQKVLGIYTFSKRCILEEFETKQRKSQGYCTVSHFNIVHYDCHMAAVRLARGRDEWESAALQNANTKCNGLLPIWGPQVSESAFASCLARHNSYIQESTGHIEPNYYLAIHDLRLLLQRFAFERSFSDDTGGGGRQSNMHLLPYGVHMILYVLNTTRQRTREEKTLKSFVETPPDKWVESSFEVDSPYYVSLLSLFVYSLDQWVENRLTLLKRLILTAHVRHLTPNGSTRIQDSTVQAYNVYKPALIYFFFIDQLHHLFKKSLKSTSPNTWPQAMAENIRKNDEAVLKACDKVLKTYQNDLLPAESFAEFCDVAELLTVIENPDGFLQETFSAYSK